MRKLLLILALFLSPVAAESRLGAGERARSEVRVWTWF